MTAPSDSPTSQQPAGIEVAPGIRVSEDNIRLQYARSSGPGGQNVNKVNTKTELWVPITALVGLRETAIARLKTLAGHRLTQSNEIHIAADNHRTQEANRIEAFDRLRELLIQAMHEPKRRRKTKPSRASKQRRIDSKKRRAKIKSGRRSSGNSD
jgi:ribosome-associated protein